MSQGAYPPSGWQPADNGPPPAPPRPEDTPEPPPATRATARVPQPPAWAPPQSQAQPPSGPPSSFAPPPPGVYGGSGGFGSAPPSPPAPSAPEAPSAPARASASVPTGYPPQQPTFSPGTYGSPAGPPPGHAGPEPGRFANLRYDDPAIEQGGRRSKRGLVVGVVIAALLVLGLAGAGILVMLNKTSNSNSFAVNSCVKKADDKAIAVSCTETGAYQITAKVPTVDKCDKAQPYVQLQESGKPDQYLCLKPAH